MAALVTLVSVCLFTSLIWHVASWSSASWVQIEGTVVAGKGSIPKKASLPALESMFCSLKRSLEPCPKLTSFFAVYTRRSVTPLLLIYLRGSDVPFIVVKLSCRLLSNTNALTVFDKGKGSKRTAIVDGVLGELVLHKLLWASNSARATLPAMSGLVIKNASRIFLSDEAFHRVPSSCLWPENVLTGLAMDFIANVTKYKLSEQSLLHMSDANWDSLGTTLVADALSGNEDRSSQNNMFQSVGTLWSLDNPFSVGQMLQPVSTAFLTSSEKQLTSPNIFRGVDFLSTTCKHRSRLWQSALAVVGEACGQSLEANCSRAQARLKKELLADPHISLRMVETNTAHDTRQMCGGKRQQGAEGLARSYYTCKTKVESFFGHKLALEEVDLEHALIYTVQVTYEKLVQIHQVLSRLVNSTNC